MTLSLYVTRSGMLASAAWCAAAVTDPVELVGTGKDVGGSIEHSLKLVSRDLC